jgi:hypothetical protein
MNFEKIEKLCRIACEKQVAINMLYAASGRTGHSTDGNQHYIAELESETRVIENKIRKEVNDAKN